jgi:hypothetical protein
MLLVAAIAFGLASSIRAGVLLHGWEHGKAAIAESVIAAVLTVGIIATLIGSSARIRA